MHLPPRQIGCILFHKGYHFVDNCWKLGFVFLPITGESPASQLEKGSVPISHTVCCGLPSRCLECRASPRLWEGPSSQSWILLGSGAVLSPDSVGEIALGPGTEEYVTQSHYPFLSRRVLAASISQTVVSLAKKCSWATVSSFPGSRGYPVSVHVQCWNEQLCQGDWVTLTIVFLWFLGTFSSHHVLATGSVWPWLSVYLSLGLASKKWGGGSL